VRISLKGINLGSVLPDERRNLNAALGTVAENALADCERFVPYDGKKTAGNSLRDSGRTVLSDGKATLEWGGTEDTSRYARRQYYDGSLHHTTAGTCSHWAVAAAAVRGTAWAAMFRSAMGGGR